MVPAIGMHIVMTLVLGLAADCAMVVQFAETLGMDQIKLETLRSSSCSSSFGITRDGSQAITGINWRNEGLTGRIDGANIPPKLVILDLGNNERL